ncbi:MAG: hypothetical protein J7L46_01495 [Bacteroidales bacterium]|nr:hypothetical protein [Bacteroidales bacterium]
MRHFFYIFLVITLFSPNLGKAQTDTINQRIKVELPAIIVSHVDYDITIEVDSALGNQVNEKFVCLLVNNKVTTVHFENNKGIFTHRFNGKEQLTVAMDKDVSVKTISPIPLWFSIIPPLLAILFALWFREVLTSIFIGLLSGTFIISYFQGHNIIMSLIYGFFHIVDKYIIQVLNNPDHLAIIVFSMLIGATVVVITKNGGMQGIIRRLSKYATNRRSGQFITMIMGIIIFFDDYANTLVVGNTMRPVTDKLKISREKLAYIVDSTAAPIASIAFITTWIGAELSYIQSGLTTLHIDETPYFIFLNSLRYAYYPVLTIGFMFFLIWMRRDFGPMFHAEKRVMAKKIEVNEVTDNPQDKKPLISSGWNAIIPIGIIVFGTFTGLFLTGYQSAVWHNNSISWWVKLSQTIGSSDSFKSLMWASLLAVVVAVMMTVFQKLQTLSQSMEAVLKGFKSMLQAIVILTLAWALAALTQELHTADFFSNVFITIKLPAFLLPAITFLIAAVVSFSTGSSWGTMAILYPLILPASWLLTKEYGMSYDESMHIFYGVVRAVITGSVFGDHCSPISDTTILSSMASSCKHIDHVRTQLPYATTVAAVALVFGIVPGGFGISPWILYPVSFFVLWIIVRYFGKKYSNALR